MNPWIEFFVSLFIVIGATFIFIGSFGLLKLRNLMARLHGPSKATTVGVGGCLLASMLEGYSSQGTISIQEILVTFFLFITAPVTAHFLSKAYLHCVEKSDASLPQPHGPWGWSTFEKISRDSDVTKN